ncbi:alpha/beta fold hydrolase [Campylobacter sp.]|uniref:alpha/beta fold hydrolase n=1 Tax=Campylobacter sp. TaxID=205 RepID=UPI0026DB0A5C|nr:alpha/beta hydrolase [Campylobacter sp.]MDO4673762.1 alpha/beta hydrolase [Campylobacter sp.]
MARSTIFFENLAYELSYEIFAPEREKKILILHGWGASKELMSGAFGGCLGGVCQIYLDLPGFGNSSVQRALQSEDYALIVQEFLRQKKFKIDCFMGHSFGGKIATLLATQNKTPLILLSSAGIPVRKSFQVRLKIALFKRLKILGLGKLWRLFASKDGAGLSPLMYETFKRVVDEDFRSVFENFSQKALIFWGKEDAATPLSSGECIHKLISKSSFHPLDGDHFFFLRHAPHIARIIKKEL